MSKFKVGERARVKSWATTIKGAEWAAWVRGEEVIIIEIPPFVPACKHCKGGIRYVVNLLPSDLAICECALEKLLPDKDTYHKAGISLGDMMKQLRTKEKVTCQ